MTKRKMRDHDLMELYAEGLLDVEIAEIMGISSRTVYSRRKELGLPKNQHRSRSAWVFTVYDHHTKTFVMEGTVREISDRLYISPSSVRWYARQTAANRACQYDVYHREV